MDIFGGLLIIAWMAGLFLTIIWLVLPFVIFTIKLRCDEISARLTAIETRLTDLDSTLRSPPHHGTGAATASSLAKQDVLQ